MVQLTGLYVYPVKSARGIALREATLSDRGIQHDRRFMIVDGDGHFLSQRQLAVLARLETALEGGELTLSYEGVSISLPLAPPRGPLRRVRVWRDDVEALALAPEVDCFLSVSARVAATRSRRRPPRPRSERTCRGRPAQLPSPPCASSSSKANGSGSASLAVSTARP